jgi:ADP-heptose:LPS heptosyltransferase
MSLDAFAPIAAMDGISLVSLQKGPPQQAVANYFDRAALLNLGAEISDFVDTMAIIEALDLVVCVDTAIAHLAGAMGKPVWILLPYAPDWRWLLERSDSPWYPTARLFRQPSPGDWSSVMRRIAEALSE